jgi:hypothetical protein
MNFFQRRKALKGVNYLELTPFRRYLYESGESDTVTVLTPRFENKFFVKYFRNPLKPEYVKTHLDPLGSATWLEIDGTRTVQQICETLSGTLGEKISPCEERVTKYLTMLYLDKFISFKEIED